MPHVYQVESMKVLLKAPQRHVRDLGCTPGGVQGWVHDKVHVPTHDHHPFSKIIQFGHNWLQEGNLVGVGEV